MSEIETINRVLEEKKAKSAAQGRQLPPALADDRVVGTFDAAAFCNFSVSHFRALYRTGRAPPPIKLSERKLGWRMSTLKNWIDQHQPTAA
jgi:predicted DNA-binding transcriptional regulator AlpA